MSRVPKVKSLQSFYEQFRRNVTGTLVVQTSLLLQYLITLVLHLSWHCVRYFIYGMCGPMNFTCADRNYEKINLFPEAACKVQYNFGTGIKTPNKTSDHRILTVFSPALKTFLYTWIH